MNTHLAPWLSFSFWLLGVSLWAQSVPLPGQVRLGTDGQVTAIVVQPDGRIIIGGSFTTVDDLRQPNLARLSRDGHIDPSWRPEGVAEVQKLVLEGDELYVLGLIDTGHSDGYDRLARFSMADAGARDTVWRPEAGGFPITRTFDLAVQGEHVYLEGEFAGKGDFRQHRVARFFRRGGGLQDKRWAPPFRAAEVTPRMALDNDFLYLATSEGGLRLERYSLRGNGALDKRWRPKPPAGGYDLQAVFVQEGTLYLAGSISLQNKFASTGLVRLSASDGSEIPSDQWLSDVQKVGLFCFGRGFFKGSLFAFADIKQLTDGGAHSTTKTFLTRIDLSGGSYKLLRLLETLGAGLEVASLGADEFDLYLGATKNPDGVVPVCFDLNAFGGDLYREFAPGIEDPAEVRAAVRLADGRLVFGGAFRRVNGRHIPDLARLRPDGTLDESWQPNPGFDVLSLVDTTEALFVSGTSYDRENPLPLLKFLHEDDEAVASWRPLSAGPVRISQMLASGPSLILAGKLDNAPETGGRRVVKVATEGTGALDAAYQPAAGDAVAVDHGWLYASGAELGQLVRFSTEGTGAQDAVWRLDTNRRFFIEAVAFDDQYLYAGGSDFDDTDLAYVKRFSLAGAGAQEAGWSGAKLSLVHTPEVFRATEVSGLVVVGDRLYVSGLFDLANGVPRANAVRLERLAGGAVDLDWQYKITNPYNANASPKFVGHDRLTLIVAGQADLVDGLPHGTPLLLGEAGAPVLTQAQAGVFFQADPALNGGEVTGFFLTDFDGGTLRRPDGVTPLAVGDYISVAEGEAGLLFFSDGSAGAHLQAVSAIAPTPEGRGLAKGSLSLAGTASARNLYRMADEVLRVNEDAGQAVVTVLKNGTLPEEVTFSIQSETAQDGVQFLSPATMAVSFGAGDTSAQIVVPLVDDHVFLGDKTFRVTLTVVSQAALLQSQRQTTVLILDNDPVADPASVLIAVAPGPLPAHGSELTVNLTPATGAWRLVGDASWRPSGTSAQGLADGVHLVEIYPQNGYEIPLRQVVTIEGASRTLDFSYAPSGNSAGTSAALGALGIHIEPPTVAEAVDATQRGEWRRVGESAWHRSDEAPVSLPVGIYAVTFKPVPGRVTPGDVQVSISANQTDLRSVSYAQANSTQGAAPQARTAEEAGQAPYCFAGQVRMEVGVGSGVAVRQRVVLTAAHVLFDDNKLSYTSETLWLHARSRGSYEPVPLRARGSYVFDSYAKQRRNDIQVNGGSPGISTADSQRLDAAAVYFQEACARDGSSGFLMTDSAHLWLLGAGRKMLAGYPVDPDRVPSPEDRGRLFATDPDVAATFAKLPASETVYKTSDLAQYDGASGGPLFVETGGVFFPAGLFLGGSGETLVRVIDSTVVDLINRGERSANGGDNSVGGGTTKGSSSFGDQTLSPAFLRVTLTPDEAAKAGATWALDDDGVERKSLASASPPRGRHRVRYAKVAGYIAPDAQVVQTTDGQTTAITGDYKEAVHIQVAISPIGAGSASSGDFAKNEAATLTATPGADYGFDAWLDEDGAVLSTSHKLALTPSSNRHLTARFVPGPFATFKGAYTGLITPGSGLLSIKLTGQGRFSGSLRLARKRYVLSGKLDENGFFKVPLGANSVVFQLDRTGELGVLRGALTAGALSQPFSAGQSFFTTASPAPTAGSYTLLLPATGQPDTPAGHGYASVHVSPLGAIRFAGVLGDRVPMGGGSTVDGAAGWELYAAPYGVKGSIAGHLVFHQPANPHALDGTLDWVRPPGKAGAPLAQGFETTLTANGSAYSAPAFAGAGRLTFGPGGLTADFRVEGQGRLTTVGGLKLQFINAKGLFEGSYRPALHASPISFGGAVSQKTGGGLGVTADLDAVRLETLP